MAPREADVHVKADWITILSVTEGIPMRTTLNLDDQALAEAMAYAEGTTKTEVINEALRNFARGKRRRKLLDLRGQVEWQGDIDALRKRR